MPKKHSAPVDCANKCEETEECNHYSVTYTEKDNCILWKFATTPTHGVTEDKWTTFRCSDVASKCVIFTSPLRPVVRLSNNSLRPRYPHGLICIANTQCDQGFCQKPAHDPDLANFWGGNGGLT